MKIRPDLCFIYVSKYSKSCISRPNLPNIKISIFQTPMKSTFNFSKKGFHRHHNLEIFVVGLKNTVFQICSFPLQEWCIIYRRTYLRQKYGDMLEKGVPPCMNYQQ